MYFSPTLNSNEIGDFEVAEHCGELHLFYLALPSHDTIGHLASRDGIHWDRLPDAMRTGVEGPYLRSHDDALTPGLNACGSRKRRGRTSRSPLTWTPVRRAAPASSVLPSAPTRPATAASSPAACRADTSANWSRRS